MFVLHAQATVIRILDSQGSPVPGAIVTPVVVDEGERRSPAPLVAGADGTVTVPLEKGLASLTVRAPGKAFDWVDFYGGPPPKEIRLAPAGRIRATFLDPAGKPLAGLPVFPALLIRRQDEGGVSFALLDPATTKALTAMTGVDGSVEIGGLPQGAEVRLDVRDDRFVHPEGQTKLQGGTTQAKPLRLEPAAWVAGRVSRDGRGVPGIKVQAQAQRGMGWGIATTDAEGRYRITQLAPDLYNVALDLPPAGDRTAKAVEGLLLKGGERAAGKEFELIAGSTIAGRVVDAAGKPGAGLPIGVYGPAHPQSGGWVASAVADAEGRFRFRVPAGAQYVYVMDGEHKADARIATEDGKEKAVELRIPEIKAPHLGHLTDARGAPVGGAQVLVDVAPDDEAHRYRDVRIVSKPDGSFEVPGDFAFPITFRARKGDLAAVATAKDAASLTATLATGSLRAATGVIAGPDGRPIPGARVQVFREQSSGMSTSGEGVTTDAQGRFRVEGLWPDQKVYVQAIADGYGLAQAPRQTLTGATTDLGRVALPVADSFVGGRVEDEKGRPVVGAEVNLGNAFEKRTRTDERGAFRVDGVPKGAMSVSVQMGDRYLNRTIATGRADHVLVLKHIVAAPAGAATEAPKPIAVGRPAPELATDAWLNAKPTTLAALRGRVVVLDFWAIWCGPCRAELPNMVRLAARLKGKKATVIGMHDSSTWAKELTTFAKKNGLTYALAVDRPVPGGRGLGRTSLAYGVSGIPTVAVIDAQGRIAYNGHDRREAERVVDRLLARR